MSTVDFCRASLRDLHSLTDPCDPVSIVTRYFVYVLPLALIIAVPVIVGATVAKDAELGGVRIVWFFTWVEILWLSLWVSKIVAHCQSLSPAYFSMASLTHRCRFAARVSDSRGRGELGRSKVLYGHSLS